jgi:AAA family ATP:ADP antiporter
MADTTDHGAAPPAPPAPAAPPAPRRASLLKRLLPVEPREAAPVLLAAAYNFFLLQSYYVMRPFRDVVGAGEVDDTLPWLYLGTLAATLLVSLAFGAITARAPRGRFIPWVYRFLAINILAFFVLFRAAPAEGWRALGICFFIWLTVFNLLAVSVFWSFMADLFGSEQGKRLFALIAVGGSVGAIAGSTITRTLAEPLGAVNLLLVSALLLEAACWCVRGLNRLHSRGDVRGESHAGGGPLGGTALDGVRDLLRSPYLLGIALFMLCYTISSTFLEVTKLRVGAAEVQGTDALASFFANIDLWTNVATVAAQLLLTGRVMARFGVAVTLSVLPAVTLAGFVLLALAQLPAGAGLPLAVVLTSFIAVRRATNYAFARPAREVLYTVVSRAVKYKSKNLIDTFVYRGGDQIGVWAQAGLAKLPWGGAAVALAAIPLALGWLAIAAALGRRQRARAVSAPAPASAPTPA